MNKREANGILTVVICILTVCKDIVRPEFFGARCCPDTTQRVHMVLKKQNWEMAFMVKQYQKICLMVKFIICWKIKFTREVMETSQIG